MRCCAVCMLTHASSLEVVKGSSVRRTRPRQAYRELQDCLWLQRLPARRVASEQKQAVPVLGKSHQALQSFQDCA